MTTPDWAGLDWQCTHCGATYTSEAAKRVCELEDQQADRDARRR